MVIVIIFVLGSYIDWFYGYYLTRPARCGTLVPSLCRYSYVGKG